MLVRSPEAGNFRAYPAWRNRELCDAARCGADAGVVFRDAAINRSGYQTPAAVARLLDILVKTLRTPDATEGEKAA